MVIIGKGGFAREVESYIFDRNCGKATMMESHEFSDCDKSPAVIAIGDPATRVRIDAALEANWTRLNFGRTHIDLDCGDGTIICPGAILTVGVWVGCHVIINLNCTVGHNAHIGDFTTLSPGVHVSGNVYIGKRCYIGSGAVIREKVLICDDVVIGAGSVVVSDITEPGTYVGVPAKRI